MSTRKSLRKWRKSCVSSGGATTERRENRFWRRPQIETLEHRTLLSGGAAAGVEEVLDAARLSQLVSEGILIPAGTGSYLIAGGAGGAEKADLSLNEDAAVTTNADELWSGASLKLNLTGSGLTVGIWDAGAVRSTHEALENRVDVVDSADEEHHSTHIAGTIGGDGVDEPDAHGMATAIDIRSRTWVNDRTEFPSDASSNLIDLSNHSYGNLRGWTDRIDMGSTLDS